jgi:uncharacterized protein YjeT (DUF2065 family)
MWVDVLTAISLFLVLEGLFPFVSPNGFKRSMAQILQIPDSGLRIVGFASMALGALLLYLVR